METRVVDDVPLAFADLVQELAPRTFALTGGTTGKRCYAEIARRGGSWAQTTFLMSDERWVPLDHPDSNEGQARRVWLDGTRAGAIASLRGDADDIHAAASAYHAYIRALGQLDLCHLGLGDDGHVASLFPGSPALEVTDRLVVATGDDAHDWPRLSFTYPAIARCRTVVVTAMGAGKRAACRRVHRGDTAVPATHVRAAEQVVWLVDDAAGR